MIFNADEVNLPERLLQSLTSGRLVVFVGAGVSARAFPNQPLDTFYPNFEGLARQIANRIGRELSDQEDVYLKQGFVDRVLGDWDGQSGAVRRYAAEILSANESGQRIDLHQSLLALFAGDLIPRIVTTNFDKLLFRASDVLNLAGEARWRRYVAPSLPPASRFSGICCLHGTVEDPSEMVLTDKNIGRAYLDEGWALRFAHAMFQQFDVLFVGYSLEDPPLRYLSLALEGARSLGRWALVPAPSDAVKKQSVESDWRRRHVEPIWYPVPDSDYRALERTIRDWATDNARSFLDRRAVLAQIASEKPSNLPPHQLSRAEYFLREPASLRDFANTSLGPEWFDKFLEWNHFDFLLKGQGSAGEADGVLLERLIDWLTRDYVAMLGKLSDFRDTLHVALIERFCRRAQEGKATTLDTPSLVKILEFFRPRIEREKHLSFAINVKLILEQLLDNGYPSYAIWLFTQQLRTQNLIRIAPSFSWAFSNLEGKNADGTSELEVQFDFRFVDQLSEHRSRELFDKVLRPRISAVGSRLVHALTQVFLEIRAFDQLGRQYSSTDGRSAIEQHQQDRYRNGPTHNVLNLLRDAWEALLSADRGSAESAHCGWEHIDDGLIQRLRIHAMRRLLETQ